MTYEPTLEQKAFARVLVALGPYLPELTFVGGWAHRLYALHELARPPGFEPLMTADTDIATAPGLRVHGASMSDLLKRNGFQEELMGDETPPVSEYRLGKEHGGLYVEFLAPQLGSGHHRDGSADATVAIAGVTAQKLKYLDILLRQRWSVRVTESGGYPVGAEDVTVCIPNPAAFLFQKVLVLGYRKPGKRAKDVLYLHDTLQIFSEAIDSIRSEGALVLREALPNWVKAFHQKRESLFSSVNDLLREASLIAVRTGRAEPPTPERLRVVCEQGLARIFSDES